MKRRNFNKIVLASTGALIMGTDIQCQIGKNVSPRFPKGTRPEKLSVLEISEDMDWHLKNFLTCFQGLVNRKQTRLYLIHSKQDKFWLNYYKDQFDIDFEVVDNIERIIVTYADEISGYVVYDPNMPHSMNIATTLGAIKNGVPVSNKLEEYAIGLGLKKIDDLSGRWENLYQAYDWALENLFPQSNQQIMAQLCVHHPHWPTSTFVNRDYVIAHNILSVDLSSSERDKGDYNLLRKFYEAYPEETVVMGWHCVRDKEHEAIALSSEYGHYGMCTLRTSNLTVHTSLQLKENVSYKQRSVNKHKLTVEDKVYIAYMATDGDAAWFVQNLINTDWANPMHGEFKYNWGFLPMAYDLLPGMVKYYLENMKSNDYFVAGPSGATYTYPHLHPNPKKFMKLSQYYMNRCGLKTVHMTNWNDRDWWQEVDLPKYHNFLRENLTECVGYVRGMGESAFEKHFMNGGKPYIFCGEGIHKGNDIYQTMKDFIDACPNRPLFIYNLVNHSIPMDQIKTAMDRFPEDSVELVHLDELLLLIEKAYDEGKITNELYPEKKGLRNILAKEARQSWLMFYNDLKDFQAIYNSGESAFINNMRNMPIGLEEIDPGEFLAFASIWDAMKLVKISLESKGIWVNHKSTATKKFITEYSHLRDFELIKELQDAWDNWHSLDFIFKDAKQRANRLFNLAEQLNEQHFNSR